MRVKLLKNFKNESLLQIQPKKLVQIPQWCSALTVHKILYIPSELEEVFFVDVEFKYANINVNSTSGSKVTPTEHFYCKDEDLKLPRVSFAVILCSLFWDKPWNCSFATRFTLLLLNYRYQFLILHKFYLIYKHELSLDSLKNFNDSNTFHSSPFAPCVYSHNSPRGRASRLAGTPDRFAHWSYKRRYQILGYS